MSLTNCIKKAGDLFHPEDKNAILERVRQLRKEGVKPSEAAKMAVAERQEFVASQIEAGKPEGETEFAAWQKGKTDLKAKSDAALELAAQEAKARVQEWHAKNLPPHDPGLDIIADQRGFSSADEMLQAISDFGPKADVIQAMTDQRMLEKHGEFMDPKSIEDMANEALHNKASAKFLATGLKSLTKTPFPAAQMARAAKEAAVTAIGNKRIIDISPRLFINAEQKTTRQAQAETDLAKRTELQRAALLNNALARAATDALAKVDKGVRYLNKVGDSPTIDVDYRNQINQLLELYDLKPASDRAIDKRVALRDFLASLEGEGKVPPIPEELVNATRFTHYKEMTSDEFSGLVDSIKMLEHLGRMKNRLLLDKQAREFGAIRDEMADSIIANAGNREARQRKATTDIGKDVEGWDKFRFAHMKVAILARVLDGNVDNGPVWNHVINTANERGNWETMMRHEATLRAAEVIDPLMKGGRVQRPKFYKSINRSMTKEEVFFLLANMGNKANIQRVLGGEGWRMDQILPVLSSLSADEIRLVQKVWDHFESYRPLIAAKETRVYGKEPEWVTPAPIDITASDGTVVRLDGGYFPIVYDPIASQRAADHAEADDAKRMLAGAYTSATTRRGYTKTRLEEVKGRPLMYSASSYFGALNEVIHDLAWHEWLIDTNKILRSDKVSDAIRAHYGDPVARQFKTWVRDIAVGEKALQGELDGAVARLRHGVSVAGLGFNVMTAAIQPLGLTQSIVRVGAKWIGRGVAEYIAHPIRSTKEANELSQFMANRQRTRFRELNELMGQIEGLNPVKEQVANYAYWLMMRAQQMVDVPTWHGAYQKAISEGFDQTTSVAVADQAVIDSQGGGQLKDLSAIERGTPLQKLFTVFYGFMNTAANMGALQTMSAKTPAKKAKLAVDYLMLYSVPAVLSVLLKDALIPGDTEDDWQTLARRLGAAQIDYLMGLMVVAREFGEGVKVLAGVEDYPRSYAGPSGVRLIADMIKLAQQTPTPWNEQEFDTSFRKSAINAAGDMFGLPAAQINRSWSGAEALAEEKTENPAALVFGYQEPR